MKGVIIGIISLTLFCGNSCTTEKQDDSGFFVEDADYIQIVLFHLAQRCESCTAVERETQWLLEEEYREEVLDGRIKFVPLNFQNENGKTAARLLRASGQTLFVVKGDHISDLTSAAFMYANTHPENYQEALRKALNNYLK